MAMSRNARRRAKKVRDMDAHNTALALAGLAKRKAIIRKNLSSAPRAPRTAPGLVSAVYSDAHAWCGAKRIYRPSLGPVNKGFN